MIHKYKQNGCNIVLDVNSGSVHLVDDVVFDLLDYISSSELLENFKKLNLEKLELKHSRKDLEDAFNELVNLYSAGLIFTEENVEIAESLKKNLENTPIKSMCLNVAHDCNLRCKYCFASTGNFGTSRKLMNWEVAKSAIDFLVKNSGNRHNLEVDFFGGEPLMNFDVVKKTVIYARTIEKEHNKNFRFTITTNGLLLSDEIIEFINKEMFNVVLSLDGRKNINDSFRVTLSGSGSYDAIVPKFQKLIKGRKGKDYYVRGTFTKNNLDFSRDVLHINSLGFNQISVEPVVSSGECDESFIIGDKELAAIYKEYEKLTNSILDFRKKGKYFNFFHFMVDLENGPCILKKLKGCGCGVEYVAVTPEGDVYPCHQFVGKTEWEMGNVLYNNLNSEIRNKFINANVYTKCGCRSCWAKFYCSGGCNANNFAVNKDVLKPHSVMCSLQKKRLECAIFLQFAKFCVNSA